MPSLFATSEYNRLEGYMRLKLGGSGSLKSMILQIHPPVTVLNVTMRAHTHKFE